MKGLIFNLVEHVVVTQFGPEAWESILDRASLDGAYTAVGNYDDGQLMAIAASACEETGMATPYLLEAVGLHGVPFLAERYPQFFANAPTMERFLEGLESVIHTEVRKIYPGANPPLFEYESMETGYQLTYSSQRNLPHLALGMLHGTAAHYKESVRIDMTIGDESTAFVIRPIESDE